MQVRLQPPGGQGRPEGAVGPRSRPLQLQLQPWRPQCTPPRCDPGLAGGQAAERGWLAPHHAQVKQDTLLYTRSKVD
jgi:hypothetical protein